jgi:hypothetical protein
MSNRRLTAAFLLGTAVHCFGGSAYAQGIAATAGSARSGDPTTESADVKGFLARTVKIQGVLRARWEAPQGSDFTVTPADSYLLTRIRLGVSFQPTGWLRFFAETQDSRATFYKANPTSSVADPFDFRQGYVEVGRIEGQGVKVRLGRQDLLLGSGRLMTSGDWSNVTKAFDIVHGTVTATGLKMDVVAGSVVAPDVNRMDRHKPGEHVYGVYTTLSKLVPHASVEPYFFARTQMNVKGKDGKAGDGDTLYTGGRVFGTLPPALDYSAEVVRELGSYADDAVRAWGYVAGGGWRLSHVTWKPRLNSDYIYASGDSGVKDGRHQSFDYLYGANQPYYGLTGLFGWRNLKNWRAGVELAPWRRLKVKVDFRDYWLANVHDGLYNCSGTRTVMNAKATSAHVGEGVDAQFNFTLSPKTLLGVGVGNIAPGSYLAQSGKTSGYVYPYMTLTRQL